MWYRILCPKVPLLLKCLAYVFYNQDDNVRDIQNLIMEEHMRKYGMQRVNRYLLSSISG